MSHPNANSHRSLAGNVMRLRLSGNGAMRTLEGREYFVVSAVILTEGVHCGTTSDPDVSCCYYPAAELEASVPRWDNVPITVLHPSDLDGNIVSARDPKILNLIGVGRAFNTAYDPQTTKLTDELWIDMARLAEISPEAAAAIRNGDPLDVSTGIYFNMERRDGEWNGEHYGAVVTDYIGDHIALLPGVSGACSWADGCGVRANAARQKTSEESTEQSSQQKAGPVVSKSLSEKTALGGVREWVRNFAGRLGMWINEASHDEIRYKLQRLIDRLDGNGWIHFIREVFSDHLIYCARTNDPSVPMQEKLYRQTYSVGADDAVMLTGEPTEVTEVTTYEPVNTQRAAAAVTAAPSTNAGKEHAMACNKDLIAKLIANSARFTETDAAWLSKLPDDELTALAEKEKADKAASDAAAAANAKSEASPAKATAEQPKAKAELTAEEYVAAAPPDVRAVLRQAMSEQAAKKAALIKGITENAANQFTECQLKAKDVDELQNIAALANVEPDYSAKGGGGRTSAENQMPDPIPVFDLSKK